MNLSAKAEYACLAVLELATRHDAAEPVCMRTIAEAHAIPSQFLVQILLQLKSAGIVRSIRGAGGGYRLAKSPDRITLGKVVTTIEGKRNSRAEDTRSDNPTARVLVETWQRIAHAQQEILESTTFGELATRAQAETADMYYI